MSSLREVRPLNLYGERSPKKIPVILSLTLFRRSGTVQFLRGLVDLRPAAQRNPPRRRSRNGDSEYQAE
jgi:hypothetical protein